MSHLLRKYVRKLLENVCGVQLLYVTFVAVKGENKYCCLGKESIFFVDEDRTKKIQFDLSKLNKIVLDVSAPSYLQLQFVKGDIVLETPRRTSFVEVITAFWKTDVLLKNHMVAEMQVLKDVLPVDAPRKELDLLFLGKSVDEYYLQQYRIFIPTEYTVYKTGTTNDDSKLRGIKLSRFSPFDNPLEYSTIRFVHQHSEIAASVTVGPERELDWQPGENIYALSKLRNDCEAALKRIVYESCDEYTIDYSHEYRKTTNLSGDTSSWLCWEARAQLEEKYVGVMYSRRSFIPTFAETYQDIIVVVQGNWNYTGGNEIVPFLGSVREIADTISADSDHFFYDKLTIQARLDSLMCNEDYYDWIYKKMKLAPKLLTIARSFLQLLADGIGLSQKIFTPEIQKELILDLDGGNIFSLINECNKHTPILSEYNSSEDWNQWKDRVSRYMSYCVDGGLVTNIDINFLLKTRTKAKDDGNEDFESFIDKVIGYLFHLRMAEEDYDVETSLNEKITKISPFEGRILCNEVVGVKLLQLGYFEDLLPRVTFVLLLAKIIEGTGSSNETVSAAAVKMSEIADEVSFADAERLGILKSLGSQLSIRTDHEVLISIGQALLSFSKLDEAFKQAILDLDVVNLFDTYLIESTQDLAVLFTSVVLNLSKDVRNAENLLGQGIISSLLRMLSISDISLLHEQTILVLVETLWKLARNQRCLLEMRAENIFGIVDSVLATSLSVSVLEMVSGFLMTICSKDIRNKKIAGEIGIIPKLVLLLRENTHSVKLLRNIEGALMVLSTVPSNRGIMKDEGLVDLINDLKLIETAENELQRSFVKQIVATVGKTHKLVF